MQTTAPAPSPLPVFHTTKAWTFQASSPHGVNLQTSVWCLPSTRHGSPGMAHLAWLYPHCSRHRCGQKEHPSLRGCCFSLQFSAAKGWSKPEALPVCCAVPLLASLWPSPGMYRAKSYKSHLIHPEHHHTGFVASSYSCSYSTSSWPGPGKLHSVCWCTCPEAPKPYISDFPSPPSCILTQILKLSVTQAYGQGGVSFAIPRAQQCLPHSPGAVWISAGITARDWAQGASRVPAVPLVEAAAPPFTSAALN